MSSEEVSIPVLYRPFVRQILFLALGLIYGAILVEAMTETLNRIDFFMVGLCTIVFTILIIDELLLWYWNRNEDLSEFL